MSNALLIRRRGMMQVGGGVWDSYAIQTLDNTKPNYNPAVAIILNDNSIGNVVYTEEGLRYFATKADIATITTLPVTLFSGKTSVTDTNKIVTSNSIAYDFTNFDEFKYWTGLTAITAGSSTSALGAFGGCTALTSIEIPEGVIKIGAYAFYNCTSLNRIVLPSTLTNTGTNSFSNDTSFANGHVFFNGTLQQWMNINFSGYGNPAIFGTHFYIQGEELTNLVFPNGITEIKNQVFGGMKFITGNIVIPSTVTKIGESAFNTCTNIRGTLDIRNVDVGQYCFASSGIDVAYVKSATSYSFANCPNLVYLECFESSAVFTAQDAGNGTGTLIFHKDVSDNPNGRRSGKFKKIICYGDVNNLQNVYGMFHQNYGTLEIFRLKGSVISSGNGSLIYQVYSNSFKFLEIEGTFVKNMFFYISSTYNGFIEHFGYNGVAGTAAYAQVSSTCCAKVYVGDGISKSADEAVLDLYVADSEWSAYTSKLGTWWDYNGEYKWYYVTDVLTNCTNTNPDEWPHITRGEEYRTTIQANEGYTLQSVQVQMYQCEDDGVTPDTPMDITSQVYDASTGEIYIQEVVGNVIITASAN